MLLNHIYRNQLDYASVQTRASKKELGQYLTNDAVAEFMTQLINVKGMKHIRILDAGAGAGILAIASVLRCIEQGITSIELDLYEVDEKITVLLNKHIFLLKEECFRKHVQISVNIIQDDFLLSEIHQTYDICCINPPYFKCKPDSPYVAATSSLYKGCPNIYASFVAKSLSLMKDHGQLVFITPRSFTNGFYFKGFRHYLLNNASLDRFHIFGSREALFKDSNVLQENIIVKAIKTPIQKEHVEISTSGSMLDLGGISCTNYPKDFLVRKKGNSVILLPESKEQAKNITAVEKYPCQFQQSGYFISTGPIVSYRTSQVMDTLDPVNPSIPLITSHYLNDIRIKKPVKKAQYFVLKDDYQKWLTKNSIYVLIKRISSKDDKQRVVVSVTTPCDHDNSEYLALENHVNYIGHKERDLELDEALGIALYLRSEVFEQYFRCVSGSTQINATDIRTIPIPDLDSLKNMGRKYLSS
jgi:adenine-specific DNA-methyltransferase